MKLPFEVHGEPGSAFELHKSRGALLEVDLERGSGVPCGTHQGVDSPSTDKLDGMKWGAWRLGFFRQQD